MSAGTAGRDAILKWLGTFRVSRALHVAAELDLARFVAEGTTSIPALAEKTGTHAPTLQRLLRALSSEGIFRERPDGTFENTEASDCLRDDVPGSMRPFVFVLGDSTSWRPWEHLAYSVRTGKPAFDHVFGEPLFDYLVRHPDTAAMFDQGMAGASNLVNDALVQDYDFSEEKTLVDVAGGVGSTLCAVLHAYPNLRGVLFDMAHVRSRAETNLAAQGVAARCSFVAGSFFDAVPEGGDAYFMKHILHDWDDEACIRILRACRAAMRPTARLLVCERLVRPGNEPQPVLWTDLHMLVCTPGGRERTQPEFENLLTEADFRLRRAVATRSGWSVLEGEPV